MGYTKEQMREYMRKRRLRIHDEMKARLGGQCVKCGTTENLQFDHVDPKTKLFHISGRGLDRSRKELLAEVDKCQLLCLTHHIEKTKVDIATTVQHGTVRSYRRGCKCTECRAANAGYKALYAS